MAVQQHILNWLYSVLTSEYHDVNRTYNDVAQALSQYPSLSPRTDVHTFPNGVSALLLHLSGTIPVPFRGSTYRFPISVWVPHAYPREAPLVYVTPTENMLVRPGQYVDPPGQVYHPYLNGWSDFWDKSSILDFLAILRDVFAKEPPVITRDATRPPPPAQQQPPTPPPVPPLPPNMQTRPSSQLQSPPPVQGGPPPPPPKGNGPPMHRPSPVPSPRDGGPPIPPYTPGQGRPAVQNGPAMTPNQPPQSSRISRYDSAPPLPPPAELPPRSPPVHGPPPPTGGRPQYQSPPTQPQYQPGPPLQALPRPDPRGMPSFQPPQQYIQAPPQWRQPPPMQAQPTPKPLPPPDIMDEPLTLSIPSPSTIPAPPIPPNPEKDALLHQLAQTLHAMRQRARAQNESSLAGLQAQRVAMLGALGALQSEMSGMTQLSALLTSNGNILHEALQTADGVIQNSTQHPAPNIDELLVAPTVVANQLYDLVAEERALADAIFVLGRAVERGRVSPPVFAKMTRSLAREWYLKKALVKKIGQGMNLTA